MKSMPSKDTIISDKQAPLPAGARTVEATYTGRTRRMPRSVRPARSREFKDGQLTVWTHSQGVFPLRGTISPRALEMKPPTIRCIHMEGAGCYGHNGADDVALDAALLARACQRPAGARAMDAGRGVHAGSPTAPPWSMQAQGGAVADGRIVDWNYDVWSQSHNMRPGDPRRHQPAVELVSGRSEAAGPARQASPPNFAAATATRSRLYDLPRQRITHHLIKDMPLRTSALRTLGGYANVFAVESFMDELATAAGVDPVAFRLAHLKDPRERAVIEAAAKAANWKPGEKGDGTRGRGIGYARYKTVAAYNAVIAEVEVDRASGQDQCAARLDRGRCRPDHQSGWAHQPDRRRHHPVGELDAAWSRSASTATASRRAIGRAIRS